MKKKDTYKQINKIKGMTIEDIPRRKNNRLNRKEYEGKTKIYTEV